MCSVGAISLLWEAPAPHCALKVLYSSLRDSPIQARRFPSLRMAFSLLRKDIVASKNVAPTRQSKETLSQTAEKPGRAVPDNFARMQSQNHVTLQQIFCEKWGCSEREFVRKLLLECAYRPKLCLLFAAIKPAFLKHDLDVIAKLARCTRPEDVIREVIWFQDTNRREETSFRVRSGIRLSGQRLLDILSQVIDLDSRRAKQQRVEA